MERFAALARDFLRFMITPAFQDAIPENNWMMPAAPTSAPLPEAFSKLVQPAKTFLMSPEEVAEGEVDVDGFGVVPDKAGKVVDDGKGVSVSGPFTFARPDGRGLFSEKGL